MAGSTQKSLGVQWSHSMAWRGSVNLAITREWRCLIPPHPACCSRSTREGAVNLSVSTESGTAVLGLCVHAMRNPCTGTWALQ